MLNKISNEFMNRYCLHCKTGLCNCIIKMADCPIIQNDRDYEELLIENKARNNEHGNSV